MTEYVRLGDVCDFLSGFPFDSKKFTDDKKQTPLLRIRDVLRGYTTTYTSEEFDRKYLVSDGDMLIGMDGDFNIGIWRGGSALLNQRVCKVTCDDIKIDSRYVFFLLKTHLLKIWDKTTYSTVKHLSIKTLQNLTLPLPSLEEQKRIAAALDKMSSVIAKRKRQIALLDEAAKSLFVEMFGDPVENPMGWVVKQINSFSTVKIGPFGSALHQHDYIVGGHPLINPKHISNGTIYPDLEITVDDEKYHILDAYALSRGDVIVGRRGDIGRCAVVNEDGYICGTGSLFIRILDSCNSIYLKSVIEHPKMRKRLEDSSVGVTMKNLNAKIVSSFNIPLPPLDLQNLFAARIEALEAQRASCERGLKQMETAFAAMMQEYFG